MKASALEWLEDPVLGSVIRVEDLLIAAAILVIGLILAAFMPRLLANNIARIFGNIEFRSMFKGRKGKGEDSEKERLKIDRRMDLTVAKPIRRGLVGFYLLLFLILAVYTLPIELHTKFRFLGNTYEVWRFLQFGVFFLLILLLSLFAIEPIMRVSIFQLLGDKVSKKSKYILYRSLRFSVKVMLIVLGTFVSLHLSFSVEQLGPLTWILKISVFVMILVMSYIAAQVVVAITEPKYRTGEKSKKDMGKAVSRAIKIGIYIVGALIGLLFLGISPTAIFGGSVVAGIVLGFGLQDTISNLAAGVMIVMDKPFVIGDRIRLDWGGIETWGDVTDISLRSTWIKTPEEEMIVVPNNVIASSQVWNYTRDSPRLALKVDIGISYDSDWRLAEKLILGILKKHPFVLNKPQPLVWMKDFGESAQILQMRFWIPEVRDRSAIKSDVLKKIKDSFDENGVEIPFPYMTVVYKKDIPKPHRLTEDYRSPIQLPSTGFRRYTFHEGPLMEMDTAKNTILVPTSGSLPARNSAPFVMDTAKKMGAAVTALYINPHGGASMEGQRALRIYNEMAKMFGVDIKLLYREGDVLENILEAAEQEEATMLIMGSTEENFFGKIMKRSIRRELLRYLSIPTMIIPIKGLMNESDETYRKERPDRSKPDAEPLIDTITNNPPIINDESMDYDEG
ncbi:MAG: mechanosensitive ion channel [Candidatus Thermoplasmatota archaeon]|nr:mechanosensitive ion channel [Candidatus Thermoplasmatota archaeon]